jgi:hypothetical protein
MPNDRSDEQSDNPLYADDRNFYKVEAWPRDGQQVDHLLYAGNNLRRAQEIFAKAVAHQPASQQGSQIRGTPSSGLALGVRRWPLCLPF